MAIEFMVRYERVPDLDLWECQIESCLRDKLAISSVPALSRGPGLSGEHAHELNIFLDGDDETRTWLFMGPPAETGVHEGLPADCATFASMHTSKSFLLTLVAAATFAEAVGHPILDDGGWLGARAEVSPEAALQRLWSTCHGRTFAEAAAAASHAFGVRFAG